MATPGSPLPTAETGPTADAPPAGRPPGEEEPPASEPPPGPDRLSFMFAVGIECSYPTLEDGRRIDQFAATDHYERWEQDLRLVRDLELRHLRYGPPLHRVWLGPGRYDWDWLDRVMAEMRRLGVEPIVDVLHFGLPDWIGTRDAARPWFQNPDWPDRFADYAEAFARRYPHVRYYTPVNEIYVTALFSGLYGWWNECRGGTSA